jgi:hypothetical protein
MLNWLLRQKLWRLFTGSKELKGWLHQTVEEKGRIDEKYEANHLKPLERLPAQPQRDEPDEKCPACVDGRSRGRTDASRHRQAEEVEATIALLVQDAPTRGSSSLSELTQC